MTDQPEPTAPNPPIDRAAAHRKRDREYDRIIDTMCANGRLDQNWHTQ